MLAPPAIWHEGCYDNSVLKPHTRPDPDSMPRMQRGVYHCLEQEETENMMKTALTALVCLAAIAGTASAEKYRDPNAPTVWRTSLNIADRVANCMTVSGFPTNVVGTVTIDVPADCCDWTITACGNPFLDCQFTLYDAMGGEVAYNEDGRCSYPCAFGPSVLGSAYGDACLTAGVYTMEIYVYSYRDGNCGFGSTPFDWDICWDFCSGGSADTNDQPVAFELGDAFPNPFNPSTTINFSLAETADASLKVFNVAGAEVANLVSGLTAAGEHNVTFDAASLTSGVYFYTLEVAGMVETRKMILVK